MHRFILLCVMSAFICSSCAYAEKKEIKASEIIKLIKAGKPVQMVDKIILDDLDFTNGNESYILNANTAECEVKSNIFFSNCIFMGKVTSNGKLKTLPSHTCFKSNVVFTACDFRGEVDLDKAIIFGMINFSQSAFRENASFNNLTVWAKDSYFSEVTAEKSFSAIYASFFGNLYCRDARFDQNASFQESSVKGKLSFNNSTFKQKADFGLMEVGGAAFFNYTIFEMEATFSFSRFLNTTDFVQTKFGKKGNFEKTFFLNTVRFDNVDMDNDLILTDTYFGNR